MGKAMGLSFPNGKSHYVMSCLLNHIVQRGKFKGNSIFLCKCSIEIYMNYSNCNAFFVDK
jgi:hypothetical protein